MAFEVYSDPEEFLKITRSYLMGHEAKNNLLLGTLETAIAGGSKEQNLYMALFREGSEPELVMMCRPPYPVVFAYQDTLPDRSLLSGLLSGLSESLGKNFTGITGNLDLSATLVSLWQEMSGVPSRVTTRMRIYKLDRVRSVPGVPGRLRPINRQDEPLLQQWLKGYTREALSEEPDPIHISRTIERYLTADPAFRGLMLWEVDGVPVSMSGFSGPTPNGMRIGMVYTPDDWRCCGYASACTASVSQFVLDRGVKFCFLYTDRLNPTTNKIYQRIGYQPICDVDRYDFIQNQQDGSPS